MGKRVEQNRSKTVHMPMPISHAAPMRAVNVPCQVNQSMLPSRSGWIRKSDSGGKKILLRLSRVFLLNERP